MLDAITTSIAAALTSDATFVAALQALLPNLTAAPPALLANRPTTEVARQYPACWVVEQGDGAAEPVTDDTGLTLGGCEAQFRAELLLALVWTDQDVDTAGAARRALPALVAQLLMRHPSPGGATTVWLEAWESDRGGRHPTQVWGCRIAIIYAVPRA